jgi:hypothetical protein
VWFVFTELGIVLGPMADKGSPSMKNSLWGFWRMGG